ncbi:MAG: FIG00687856: Predicted nucleotidyltransferases [uncultured Sphingomonas sp.]|uniref:FIG00687856: Predicted nucleotidyltransferases n=1 Tax=uncultured Sphingomonas sp. TaxID=158754 RepID=A0A6J4SF03_9SPHN|nr:MAG: FIG00687856: Predicted nucleotidyltransferases [uncultured Sphingomonas sp.]
MTELRELVAEELSLPVDRGVAAVAGAIAARHGAASRAVLFYGSCLRQQQLEGLMLDFYLIVSDYREAYAKRWLAAANRLIPPNVFYFEADGLVAKYAVLSEADFAHECGPEAWTVSTAARFAQPSRLVWSADAAAAERTIDIVSTAAPTLMEWTIPHAADVNGSRQLWARAFELTFAAELRAERLSRSATIVEADPDRYERVGAAAVGEIAHPLRSREEAIRWWRRKQHHGKRYSIARLAKASATFAGGADYIAWKINRHAATSIALKPWQRRHPLLAAITLLPRLLRGGVVR